MQATNLQNNKRVPVTHGELCLIPVDEMPEGKTSTHKLYVAAHSETGHNHVIEATSGIEVVEKDSERYMLIKEVSKLFHQKTYDIHETQYIAPGAYKVTHKTEYDPFQKVIREVWD